MGVNEVQGGCVKVYHGRSFSSNQVTCSFLPSFFLIKDALYFTRILPAIPPPSPLNWTRCGI